MIIGEIDLQREPLVVAEIGNNHEGDCARAEEMINRAAEAGVGAVKLQTYRTAHYVSRRERARFERLESFALTEPEFERLAEVARCAGVTFLSTPFDLHSARFLDALVPAFKIASGDNTFFPLLETVAATGKPVILSGGLADMDQLRGSKSFVERSWRELGIRQALAVLHCVSAYPVPPAEANLAAIWNMRAQLRCTVGYSDHTLGIDACVFAAAAGARIVEKHFTLDKQQSDFRDHQLSADPAEMAELVRRMAEVSVLLGDGRKVPQPCELQAIHAARRSIVACRDLQRGAVVAAADITWVRPGGGLAPGREHLVIGRRTAREIRAGEQITLDVLEPRDVACESSS